MSKLKEYIKGGFKTTQKTKEVVDKVEDSKYIYFKLLPDTSVKNNNNVSLAKAIVNMYGSVQRRLDKSSGGLKCSYLIDMKKVKEGNKEINQVSFYMIVPKVYKTIMREKIRGVWNKVTIEEVEEIPEFGEEKIAYELCYKNVDALSLEIDKRSNTLLSSLLNALDIMEEQDHVGVFYNFIPISQNGWRKEYQEGIDKFNSGQKLTNKNSLDYVYNVATEIVGDMVGSVLDGVRDMFDVKKSSSTSAVDDLKKALSESLVKPSEYTIGKKEKSILGVQAVVLAESLMGKDKAIMVGNSVAQSFSSISNDNELIYKPIMGNLKQFDYEADKIRFVTVNKCSVEECHNFMQLPGKELVEQYKLNHISIDEVPVPEDLRDDYVGEPEKGDCKGYIPLGTNEYRGETHTAYMSGDDTNLANLGFVAIGPQGAGKSKFFVRYGVSAVMRGETVIVPDFIGNCKLCDEMAAAIPKDKQVWLDMTIPDSAQGFVFNEITNKIKDIKEINRIDERTGLKVVKSVETQKMELYDNMTQATMDFIDSIYTDSSGVTGSLTGKMRKILAAACKIVYRNEDASLYDIRECIRDHVTRKAYRESIPQDQLHYYKEELEALSEIDEYDKEGNLVGTRYANVQYILDRIDRLMERTEFKGMVKKKASENIDLIDVMDKGKAIFIRMPEDTFSSRNDKNILTTFYIAKIWLACQLRFSMHDGKQVRIHVILDEIFHAPNTYKMLDIMLRQARKFRCKFVFSAHSLNAIKELKSALWEGGSSYMILGGSDKGTFEELALELAPFKLEELMKIPRFSAVCLMRCKENRKAFVVKLPKLL